MATTIAPPVSIPDELDIERLDVKLSVHEGRIVTSPETFVAHPRSIVTWRAHDPFLVRFDHDTPVWGGREIESRQQDDAHVAQAAIRDDATRRKPYKYTVAMSFRDESGPRVLMADPDGVVEPDPVVEKDPKVRRSIVPLSQQVAGEGVVEPDPKPVRV